MLEAYAVERTNGERFGDFVIRMGVIEPCLANNQYHNYHATGKDCYVPTPSGTNNIYW